MLFSLSQTGKKKTQNKLFSEGRKKLYILRIYIASASLSVMGERKAGLSSARRPSFP